MRFSSSQVASLAAWLSGSRELPSRHCQAGLDEEEAKLARRFAGIYRLITRDDRLGRIAEDVVRHLTGRGYRGKAMFIAIDKATAVGMHDKVRAHRARRLGGLKGQIADMERRTWPWSSPTARTSWLTWQ